MSGVRDALLDAASELAMQGELEVLDCQAIQLKAGLTAEDFQREFESAIVFCERLHRRHIENLLQALSSVMQDMSPGWHRLERAITVFWDVCVEAIPVRALVKKARLDAGLNNKITGQNRAFAHMLAMEMKIMGWPAHEEVAFLTREMVEEIAQVEFEARAALPKLRAAFWGFVSAYQSAHVKLSAA
jgi:hypothetical protein